MYSPVIRKLLEHNFVVQSVSRFGLNLRVQRFNPHDFETSQFYIWFQSIFTFIFPAVIPVVPRKAVAEVSI